MKNFITQLKKQALSLSLRKDERKELRERLLSYMEYHPMPENQTFSRHRSLSYKVRTTLMGHSWVLGRVTAGLAVFFLVVVPVAAERALPGDVLYPIKVRINEELRGALVSSSPYQQVEWETERLERRISEAKLLADAGELTPAAEAEVAEAIKKHSDAAKASINSIRESDNDDATLAEIVLSSSLEVSAKLLENDENEDDEQPSETNSKVLVDAVNLAREEVKELSGGQTPNYDKLLVRLEMETTRAHEYFDSLNGSVSDEDKAHIEKRLSDIKSKVESATAIRDEDDGKARELLVEALGSTSKLISFMTNLDVRSHVTVEDLVPANPTDEERVLMINEQLRIASELEVEVDEKLVELSTSSNDYMAIKDSLDRYQTNLETASSSLATGDLEGAENASEEALELIEGVVEALTTLGQVDNLKEDLASTTEEVISVGDQE